MSEIETLIAKLPKAELHLHLEGSLEPEQMFRFAKRNGVSLPFASIEEIKAAYNFRKLQDFLDIYYQGMAVLQTEMDYYELTSAYLQRVHEDAVKHVEVFFDPQGHTERGVPFQTVLNGISEALDDGYLKLGITSKLIMCFLRHLSEEQAFVTLKEAEPFLDNIFAVGLDSSELGHPPVKFKQVFKQAKDMGMHCVAHAGEEGPPDYIYQALDILKVDRIDHGNRCLEDDTLVQRLVQEKMTLTVCPLSNLKLCVVQDMQRHPVKNMLQEGLRVTINSDDPAYFGGYVNDNYLAVSQALNITPSELITLAKNSFYGSFLSEEEKQLHLQTIDEYQTEINER